MSWFSDLTGIAPETRANVYSALRVEGHTLISNRDGRKYCAGVLSMPMLSELRTKPLPNATPVSVSEVVTDVQALHRAPENAGASFQVASQFNLLEMAGPDVTPEDGIERYEFDRTQGPACAIACGAGTIFRNYFVKLDGQIGQNATRQIDCLGDLGTALSNDNEALWRMKNGYALLKAKGIAELNPRLASMSPDEKDRLRGSLRIGCQSETEVTLEGTGHKVTQLFCSAMPVSYGAGPTEAWREIAVLVLEASYEATLRAAVMNAQRTGNPRVYLTMIGGGAFGNEPFWISGAIIRAIEAVGACGLEIVLVSYGAPSTIARQVLQGLNRSG